MPDPVVVTCGGRRCLALRPDASTDLLRAAVRETSGAVLIRSQGCLGPCVWAPVALVAPRSDPGGGPLAATMLGPLHHPADLHSLADWVRGGGPSAAPLPAQLRDLQRRDLA
ncbi:(2Fe-2S) ferredoxin domain-containing protein [Cryptosporangium arvum]|uniref:(2Fe-2S) ferredoxin domain-containing protein n=1 Tax=Cryptosporangium arvum TaxID=80871 RepID=UPI0012EE68C0|nr:(2Fe-2S) ferredoxin domain-containing protein [Cryptosporangium arvum]